MREKRVFRLPVQLEVLAGLIGIAVFVIVVYAGFAGVQTSTANLTPTVVYVLFWVGLPVLSCIFGDIFRPFNPWLRDRPWHRLGRSSALGAGAEPIEYPTWLGPLSRRRSGSSRSPGSSWSTSTRPTRARCRC